MFMQKPYTYSVDWWAMGIVLYECTFNKHPFQGSGSSIEKAIVRNPIIFPNQYEVTPGRFPYVESQDRTDFIKRLLVRTVHERLGCGSQGNLEIKNHQWFQKMDWNMVLRKQVVPDFIPDPSQNNYDFGAALEELLYESSPLASKPVKKRKDKKDPPPSLSMLWQDDSMVSRKQTEHNKLEQELDYIEQYFEPYIKPISPVAVVETPLASIQMPPTQREYTRSKKSTSRKSLDAGKMLLEEQQAFKTGPRAVAMKRGHSQHSKSQSISSFDIDESVPPIPNNLVYRDSFIQTKLKEPMGSNPMLTKMAPTRTMDSTNRTIDSKISGYSIDQVDPSPPKKYNQQIRQKSNDTGSSKQSPATSPFKIKTQLKPVDIFDTAFKELDLSFPDRPEMTPSPKSPTKKSRRS
jgi:hypothetical protein